MHDTVFTPLLCYAAPAGHAPATGGAAATAAAAPVHLTITATCHAAALPGNPLTPYQRSRILLQPCARRPSPWTQLRVSQQGQLGGICSLLPRVRLAVALCNRRCKLAAVNFYRDRGHAQLLAGGEVLSCSECLLLACCILPLGPCMPCGLADVQRCLLCAAVARQMQEQQLRARQLVLQQQAASAVAAASKTQREVRVKKKVSCCLGRADGQPSFFASMPGMQSSLPSSQPLQLMLGTS